MNKAEFRMLEKLFAAEVDAALSGQKLPGIVQSKSKVMLKLEAEGYAERVQVKLGGRFPVVVEGWQLTLAGNAAYCMNV